VTGFADNIGNAQYNLQLSLRRAESVEKALVASGIDPERVSKESKGEDVSRVSSRDRWKSRRVEIQLAPEENEKEREP
jgi:OOP family OmpA-OmpF porin